MADSTELNRLPSEAAEDVRVVAKGGAVQVAGQLTQRGLSFVFQAVAFRLLGASPYGLYRQVSQVVAIAGQLGLAGFNYASMRWIARARAAGDHGGVRGAVRVGLTGAAVASALVMTALFVVAGPLAERFGDSPGDVADFEELFRIGAVYVPFFALLQVLRYCTQAYKTMVPSVTAGNIVQPAVRFVLGTAALIAGLEVAGAVWSLTVSMAVSAVVAGWMLRSMLTEQERAASPHAPAGAMVRFALPQAGASLLGIQSLGLGIIIVGLIQDNAAAALFGLALSLQGPANVFLGGIVNIWAPVVSDLHGRGEIDRLGALYKTINRWIATFSFPAAVALMLEPDLFVRLFGGEEAAAAAPVVAILAVGNVFYTGTGPTGYVISMTGRPGINMMNSVAAVALYVGLGYAVVPEHGVVGMAVVDAAVTALVNTVRVVEAKLLVGIQPFGRTYYKPVIASLAAAGVLAAAGPFVDERLALEAAAVAAAGVVYGVALKLFGVDPEEAHVLQRIRKRALRRGRG